MIIYKLSCTFIISGRRLLISLYSREQKQREKQKKKVSHAVYLRRYIYRWRARASSQQKKNNNDAKEMKKEESKSWWVLFLDSRES